MFDRRTYKRNKAVKLQARRAKSTRDWSRTRIMVAAVLFGMVWVALWGRAFVVQVVEGPELAEMAVRQHVTSEFRTGERGNILDRKGRLLASGVKTQSVFARPPEVKDAFTAGAVLSKILGRPSRELSRKLRSTSNFVWLARQVDDRTAISIREKAPDGIYLTTEYSRKYPNKESAGRLLGFVGLDNKGLEGLEASFEDRLAGQKSRIVVNRDAAGNTLYPDGAEFDSLNRGQDLHLTLDADIQYLAENALAKAVRENRGKWGACLIVEVHSGHILAWAEYPFFNPNAYREAKPTDWRNRIAIDAFEPGSTIKPLLMAAALEESVVEPDTVIFCENGKWDVSGITIKDLKEHGELPVTQVLSRSSNIGSAKVALKLGANRYYQYLSRLGFGQMSPLPLPGGNTGILRPPSQWTKVDLASAGFGQGLSVTVPHMARAFLSLANKGVLKPLVLVLEPEQSRPPESAVFSPETAEKVLNMMAEVVTEDGTGRRARIQGVSVAGKTGTAQKAVPEGGYGDLHTASFIGFIPAREPDFLILTVVDEPKVKRYGGDVAAPIFKEAAVEMLAYLGRLPDTTTQLAEAAGTAEVPDRPMVTYALSESGRAATDKVPNVKGLSVRRAVEYFAARGIVPRLKGEGTIVSRQTPKSGTPWPDSEKDDFVLWLANHKERS